MDKLLAGLKLPFREFVAIVNPRYQFYTHCDVLIDVLQRVADGDITRLMVFMPPRHSKSETISRLFSAYYLYRHPERWVGINSYAADLAYTLSRNARENYTRAGGVLHERAFAVKHWQTKQNGGLWAAGVGGPITGKGFHLGIIDDPLKNADEARSEVVRSKQRDWYASTFYTRAEPGAAIVIVQTRWHESDLSGMLLDQENDEPEGWHVVNLPAIKEDATLKLPLSCTLESDWRKAGEALCSERYPLDKLGKIQSRIGSYFWNALYQQRPSPPGGAVFKREWFEVVDHAPEGLRWVRYWDLAASIKTSADYTASAAVALASDGTLYIRDMVRGRWEWPDAKKIIMQTMLNEPATEHAIEEALHGLAAIQELRREPSIARQILRGVKVDTDKMARAFPWAARAEGGKVKLVRSEWVQAFLDEVTAFPHGAHDDQVDTASGGFQYLTAGPDLAGLTNFLKERVQKR